MPKVLQCALCKRSFLGGTYTLIKHFKECNKTITTEQSKEVLKETKNIQHVKCKRT